MATLHRVVVAPAVRCRHRAVAVRAKAGGDASAGVQGGVTKRRCDLCLGEGRTLCPECNDVSAIGWTIDGNAQRCDRKGYVPVMSGGVFGFGAKKTGEERCGKCNASGAKGGKSASPGRVACPRCKGNKFLLFRSADWR
ncbi:unnamed product [Ostreococcus tauri]|uniref:Unnamed product n=1 Tax=Ostreococcus tauri TaxID=70448 RepID=Q01GV3_OSTTA|nr:unnamed product [Ostreococcus tauri]CAL50041.1 unnamed product [Ostreococcus tauri]|eukprot:XP_003074189.1 unnamed product [Ostreococcus tauri]